MLWTWAFRNTVNWANLKKARLTRSKMNNNYSTSHYQRTSLSLPLSRAHPPADQCRPLTKRCPTRSTSFRPSSKWWWKARYRTPWKSPSGRSSASLTTPSTHNTWSCSRAAKPFSKGLTSKLYTPGLEFLISPKFMGRLLIYHPRKLMMTLLKNTLSSRRTKINL